MWRATAALVGMGRNIEVKVGSVSCWNYPLFFSFCTLQSKIHSPKILPGWTPEVSFMGSHPGREAVHMQNMVV